MRADTYVQVSGTPFEGKHPTKRADYVRDALEFIHYRGINELENTGEEYASLADELIEKATQKSNAEEVKGK